jgi:hypothetical protein
LSRLLALLPLAALSAVRAAPEGATKHAAHAAAPHHAPPPAPVRPAPPLPSLPSVARVRVEVSREHVVVVEDVDVPRGDWQHGDLDLFVAFGAPGVPEAFDAQILAVPDGALEPAEGSAGEPLTLERAPRRPLSAQPLLGPPQMAGAVVHVPEAAFRRATSAGGMAALRLRSLVPLPAEDARTGREVLVRLGASSGTPLTLGSVQVASTDPAFRVARAEAQLCGPDADPWPLALALVPAPPTPALQPKPPIAPVLAVRHASDDLCVRVWTP